MAEIAQFDLHPGDAAPPFRLPGVDGKTWSLESFADARALVVTFWCNHCPYVQGWEGRMLALAATYTPKGVRFVLINANDARAYPDDAFAPMVRRAAEKGYTIPYLHDASQAVAHAYGARVTPHPMVFDAARRLVYQGRIDDQVDRPEQVQHRYLADALDALLAGRTIVPAERPVAGCSVKWKG